MLREHLHDASIEGKVATVFIFFKVVSQPDLLASFVDLVKLVRLRLIRSEDTEVFRIL